MKITGVSAMPEFYEVPLLLNGRKVGTARCHGGTLEGAIDAEHESIVSRLMTDPLAARLISVGYSVTDGKAEIKMAEVMRTP